MLASVNLDGRYDVLDAARYGKFDEPWYRIEVQGRRGWVAGRLVKRRSYTFPAVHLIAGLYRYGRGQYSTATEELEAFLAAIPDEDNVTRAAALEFLAVSRLADERANPARVIAAIKDLEKVSRLTPFDASVYTLRAMVWTGTGTRRALGNAVADLEHALELNRGGEGARQLLADLIAISDRMGLEVLAPGQPLDALEAHLESLHQAYSRPGDKD